MHWLSKLVCAKNGKLSGEIEADKMVILLRGDSVKKKQNEQKSQDKFNSITQKVTLENQNQTHNVKKEGVDVKMRQV